jgi:hypothetical protein
MILQYACIAGNLIDGPGSSGLPLSVQATFHPPEYGMGRARAHGNVGRGGYGQTGR